MIDLCSELLDALEELDVLTAPLGLYACEEYQAGEKPFSRSHQVWFLGIRPHLERSGCEDLFPSYAPKQNDPKWSRHSPLPYGPSQPLGALRFTLPNGVAVRLGIAQTAKIKVRKFGAVYRVDPQQQFHERWQELQVASAIREMWRPSYLAEHRHSLSGYLLIGFDRNPEPLKDELEELQVELAWENHGIHYQTRAWPDRYQRHFFVRTCCWLQRTTPADQGW